MSVSQRPSHCYMLAVTSRVSSHISMTSLQLVKLLEKFGYSFSGFSQFHLVYAYFFADYMT
jgi:hypothetical protein